MAQSTSVTEGSLLESKGGEGELYETGPLDRAYFLLLKLYDNFLAAHSNMCKTCMYFNNFKMFSYIFFQLFNYIYVLRCSCHE